MIKRLPLLLIIILGTILTNVSAQCIPDLTLTDPGIYPDSATGLPAGEEGVPYSEVIQVVVLTDTSVGGLPVVVTNITIVSVTGLPPGVTYSCNPASCIFPGGSNGCILLSGTPATAGTYYLNVSLTVNGTLFGVPISQPATVDYYFIDVLSPTGLPKNLSNLKLELLQNKPNPANNYTDVSFTSPINGDFKMQVFNLLGKDVYNQTIRGVAGLNTTRISTADFTPGVYMITIENGSAVATRRIIVSRK
jgi:hypothetical protein